MKTFFSQLRGQPRTMRSHVLGQLQIITPMKSVSRDLDENSDELSESDLDLGISDTDPEHPPSRSQSTLRSVKLMWMKAVNQVCVMLIDQPTTSHILFLYIRNK